MRLHHVQVAMPPGAEDAARLFYAGGLGMREVAKPELLRGRGGAWFRSYDGSGEVAAEIHLGVESPFRPARKAHPALLLDSVSALDETADASDLKAIIGVLAEAAGREAGAAAVGTGAEPPSAETIPAALQRIAARRPGQVVLSSPVAAELLYGLERLAAGSRRRRTRGRRPPPR